MQTANKILIHLLFWVLSFGIFCLTFNISGKITRIDLIFSGLFHISLFYGAYLNLALISAFFARKRYVLFSLGIVITLMTAIFLNQLTFNYLADLLFPGYYLISNFEFWEIGLLIMLYMLITTLLKLSYAWFELQKAKQKLVIIEKENIKSELNNLKAQINPHFLFNSLNAIYSLAIKESARTPDAIIQLADILRYVIYQSNNDSVPLKDEVKILSDYIGLQKLRIDSSSTVTFVHKLHDEQAEIAPLLLLPLVENSFKHGVKGDLANTFVDIDLHSTGKRVIFLVSNSKAPAGGFDNIDTADDTDNKGLGNENIRQRLSLLYPGKHSFVVDDTENMFKVKLMLEL